MQFIFCQNLSHPFSHGPSYRYFCSKQIKTSPQGLHLHDTEMEHITIRKSPFQRGQGPVRSRRTTSPPRPPQRPRSWRTPTFLCGVTHNDLASSLACLLHGQCCAQPLLVLAKTLAFPEAILLHDFMCYCAPGRKEKRMISWTQSHRL